GNPNSGKTTMYNVFTGLNEKVGNWAGVTIGKKEGFIKSDFITQDGVVAVDLPGAYSMSPYTPEESITSGFVRDENPDVIVNIVDATNLGRSLFLTTQLLELGIPVVVALNKSDINNKEGVTIDAKALADKLGCPVVNTVATNNKDKGLADVMTRVQEVYGKGQKAPFVQKDIDLHSKEEVTKADKERFAFVNSVVEQVEVRIQAVNKRTFADKLDDVLTNPIAGIVAFALVMWAVFALSQTYIGPFIADYVVGWIETFQGFVADKLANSPAILSAILADGIVGGVGAVVGFLPLIMVMFFLIALLEDCGYIARVTAVMDPIFKKVGLSGKSIISMIIGTGCGVPAIMATRTIRDDRERRAITMLTTWIPCGAKVPVIALFAGAFFNGAGWVSLISYATGIVLIFLGALLIKGVTGYKYRKTFFIMELPKWAVPSLKRAALSMLERAKAYIIKAATIILVCNCVVQIMSSFNTHFQLVAENAQDTSILAMIAAPFAVLLIPIGIGTWQLAAASITGFIAKENVVGTIAVVYGITRFIDVDELAMTGGGNAIATALGLTSVTAIAFLFFNLFTPPCFAAIGAMNSEMQSKGWLWSAIGLQFCAGYTVAFLIAQVGSLVVYGHLLAGFVPGLIAILVMAAAVVLISMKIRKGFDAKYALHAKAEEVML
ncbi:MAG: ferrous iron transport protein B, partial [Bacillota bacterium]|nr:ferrous iron transport protein B [Bacillota bacterium]